MQVRYLEEAEIEDEARVLLERYARDRGATIQPPVPIERIINFLDLHQDVGDIYQRLGLRRSPGEEVLGALSFKSRHIYVHHEIDPDDYPWLEGRFNFTLGHEVGHWVLHRCYFEQAEQLSFLDDSGAPDIICRKSERTARIEWQANAFASRLLMPRSLTTASWATRAGRGGLMTSGVEKRLIKSIARDFATSIQATEIRLRDLGLIGLVRAPELGV